MHFSAHTSVSIMFLFIKEGKKRLRIRRPMLSTCATGTKKHTECTHIRPEAHTRAESTHMRRQQTKNS